MPRPTRWILMLGVLAALVGALIPAYRAVQRFTTDVARLETLVPFNVAGDRPISLAAFAADGAWLAVAYDGGAVSVWDLERRRLAVTVRSDAGAVGALALAPPARALAMASQDGSVRIRDAVTGLPVQALAGHAGPVRSLAFSPDGGLLAAGDGAPAGASGAAYGRAHLWNWRAGQRIGATRATVGPVVWLSFSADGRRLAVGAAPAQPSGAAGSPYQVGVWSLTDGAEAYLPHPAGRAVERAAIAPDGSAFAAWGYGAPAKPVWLCPAAGGAPRALSEPPADPVNALAFSPDGATLATGTRGGVSLYDTATGRRRASLKAGGGAGVEAVGFTADGKVLHALDGLGRVWRWNARTGARARWAPRQ
ncbi:MAG: hypothetical protein HY321_22670 [Armatimonadetes bacterium]|nr:hypothetical protein [Armatimonadota bacterium]